jgi:hypothetical protein
MICIEARRPQVGGMQRAQHTIVVAADALDELLLSPNLHRRNPRMAGMGQNGQLGDGRQEATGQDR